MGSQEFDRRYPAMFQPGGEDGADELFVPSPLPHREHADAQLQDTAGAQALAPAGPSLAGAFEVSARRQDEAHSAGEPDELNGPGRGDVKTARGPVRVIEWSARTWTLCLAVILLTFAGSAFCMVAVQVIPGAASVDPTQFHGMMVAPWGSLILPGTSALLTAALGMLAGLFFAAARHYTARAWWCQGAAAAVGLAALAGGFLGMFSEMLFAETLYNPRTYQGNYYFPWFIVFQQAAWQLLLLGLGILALVAIVRLGRGGVPATPSAGGALWTGILMVCAGVWTWFALQFYPLAEGRMVNLDGQQPYMMQPWTTIISQAGGPLIAVGSAALFWWVFILATTRRTPVEPAFDDEPEQEGHHELE